MNMQPTTFGLYTQQQTAAIQIVTTRDLDDQIMYGGIQITLSTLGESSSKRPHYMGDAI